MIFSLFLPRLAKKLVPFPPYCLDLLELITSCLLILTFYKCLIVCILGFAGPVAMAVGTLAGSLYTFKWQPNLRKASLITVVALGISTILLPIMFAFQCDLDPVLPIEVAE